jgi:leucyl aminopeptidase (aminopeptidase T)
MKGAELHRAADRAVRQVMGVQPGEHVLVVTDTLIPLTITEALLGAAGAAGAEATAVIVSSRQDAEPRPPGKEQPSREPVAAVAAAMERSQVIFSLTQPILNGTRAETVALEAGARVLRMLLWDFYHHPTITSLVGGAAIEGSFIRAHEADIPAMADVTRRACRAIASSREARIFSAAGTDLRIEIGDLSGELPRLDSPRPGPNPVQCLDGECHEPGTWDESAGGVVAAICANAEGVVVVDHSLIPLGLLAEPIVLRIEDRRVVSIEGGTEADRLRAYLASFDDQEVYTCPAEWGFGTHPCCVDSGNFLEHEKALGAFHAALGDDIRFGGTHFAPIHSDAVFRRGSLELDGELAVEDGRLLF